MKVTDVQGIGKNIRMALGFVVALSLIVIFVYFYKFGGFKSSFSESNSDWGVFGDYLSGALGSLLSFAAFVGVLWTINIQGKQLHLMRNQVALEEMQRLISYSSQRVDDLLHQSVVSGFKDERLNGKQTLFECLTAAGTLKDREKLNLDLQGEEKYLLKQFESLSSGLISRLQIELNCLAWAIDKHQARGGDKEVFGFYIQKYIFLLYWMHKLEILEENSSAHKTFGFAFSGIDTKLN